MLVVEAQTLVAEGALATLDLLLLTAPTQLQDLQDQVQAPASLQIGIDVVTKDVSATADRKSLIRSAIVAVVLGIALTLFGTNLLDGYILRRRARREDAVVPDERGRRLPAPGPLPPPSPNGHCQTNGHGP